MRGLWDQEQPLSPSLLRSAMALVGGFLALSAAIMLIIAVASVVAKNYFAGAMQFSAGIALPFALWLGLKMLADILVALNRSHDRLEGIEEKLGGVAEDVAAAEPDAKPGAAQAAE